MNAFEIIRREEPEPPASNTVTGRQAITNYKKRVALATSAIRFSCTQAVAICIRDETDPATMWTILQKKLDATSSQEISEENLLGHIYSTCPPKFKTIITVLKRTPEMTIETLEAGLKEAEEEFKAEEMAAVVDSKSAAGLYAQGGRGRGG